MQFQLRQAEASDFDLIWQLRVATMKTVISEAYGWDEATQREYAAESLKGQIVLVEGTPIGVLTLADWGDQLHLVWMAILPLFQRSGLGSDILRHCQQLAVNAGKPLTLQVLRNNPAVHLYERFGFKTYRRNGEHRLQMRWEHNV
jgi:ribosomal protein S18 acetylase RimI-like enzyme